VTTHAVSLPARRTSVFDGAVEHRLLDGLFLLTILTVTLHKLQWSLAGSLTLSDVLTSVYLVMPVGRLRISHALIGGVTAAVLWEITRHVLIWYFATLSQVSVVYGSLTTAIVVLLSLEIAATLLLFGAQVISEYERLGREPART